MVAEVGVGGQDGKGQGDERLDPDAGCLEAPVKLLATEVGQVVVLHAHRHALPRLAHQHLGHATAGRVVLKLEELEMDVVARLLQVGDQVVEHREKREVALHGIARQRIAPVGLRHQPGHL